MGLEVGWGGGGCRADGRHALAELTCHMRRQSVRSRGARATGFSSFPTFNSHSLSCVLECPQAPLSLTGSDADNLASCRSLLSSERGGSHDEGLLYICTRRSWRHRATRAVQISRTLSQV